MDYFQNSSILRQMLSLSYGFWPLRLLFRVLAGVLAHPRWTLAGIAAAAGLLFSANSPATSNYGKPLPKPAAAARSGAPGSQERIAHVKTTGYCPCELCCNWRRSVLGLGMPVVASGPNRGRPKAVGVTASGTRARPGVIAADTNLFAIGTIMFVPGYGWGRVEDVGGAIKGYHIDLFFDQHTSAQQWGVKKKEIRFWRPEWQKPRGVRILTVADKPKTGK